MFAVRRNLFLICSSAQRPLEFFKNRADRNRLIGFVVRGHACVEYVPNIYFFFSMRNNFFFLISFFRKVPWTLGMAKVCKSTVTSTESLI